MLREPARFTLRVTITLSILVVTVITAVSLLALAHAASRAALSSFTVVLLNPLAALVGEKTRGFLSTVERAAQLTRQVVESSGAGSEHFDAIEQQWLSILATHPDLYYLQYGDTDGNFQLLTRRGDGSLATQRIVRSGPEAGVVWRERAPAERSVREVRRVQDAYDPRVRPWYRGAIDRAGLFWTDVYIHAAERRPVITVSHRVTVGGRVVGVAAASIALDDLASFLGRLRIAGLGRAFIADDKGQLIAGATNADLREVDGQLRLPTITEGGPPELLALTALPGWRRALNGDVTNLAFPVHGNSYLAVAEPLRLQSDHVWIVAAVMPEEAFLAGIERDLARSILVSTGITLLFLCVGVLLARAVTSSLLRVVLETEKVQRFNFTGKLPRSDFAEIELIFRTLDRLKLGLRAFEKYVPMRLVRILLEEQVEPHLGGRMQMMTLFFSDIRGFTAYSESVRPQELADQLGEYLQFMSDAISEHGGTVDKFVGDGVMAFWNAPRGDPKHALHATLAAIRCRATHERLPHGHFFTRFGLHTQEVLVGNFGARDRFAYTVLGDGVNLASRLEGVNKEYDTQILLSEATAAQVRDQILCRAIDRVAVSGRSEATLIFEALCPLSEATAAQHDLVSGYEAALARYFAGHFSEAAELFSSLCDRHPEDGPSKLLLARCRDYVDCPPPAAWAGVHVLSTK